MIVIEAAVASYDGYAHFVPDGELSSLLDFHQADMHAASRMRAFRESGGITGRTISPETLRQEAATPSVIDFLSLDVEGAEVDVLRNFPWGHTVVRFACVEHNHRDDEMEIDEILARHGLARVLRQWTGFDGWYSSEVPSEQT